MVVTHRHEQWREAEDRCSSLKQTLAQQSQQITELKAANDALQVCLLVGWGGGGVCVRVCVQVFVRCHLTRCAIGLLTGGRSVHEIIQSAVGDAAAQGNGKGIRWSLSS